MTVATIVQISDPHLSRTHGFFNANFRALIRRPDVSAASVVVVSGDLTVDGADCEADLAYAASELARIDAKATLALPGNHDVGEEVATGHEQVIDPTRRRRWLDHFGLDWWRRDVGNWRLLGINSQLLGSDLAAEAAQWEWIEDMVSIDSRRPTGVFLHKPLFLDRPDEPDQPGEATLGAPRQRLLGLLACARVQFIACGHLHQYRAFLCDDIEYIWAPSTAFLISQQLPGGTRKLGYVAHSLHEDGRYEHDFIAAPELNAIDLDVLKGERYRFLRDIPPEAVEELIATHGLGASIAGEEQAALDCHAGAPR